MLFPTGGNILLYVLRRLVFGKDFPRLLKDMIVAIQYRMKLHKQCSQNPLQTTAMESVGLISNGILLLTIVAKFSILVVCGAPGYASVYQPILLIWNIANEKKTEIQKNLIIPHCSFYVKVQAYEV